MKHSVTIKFIAVFLCTLSLLSAVASAGGIAVLTGMNLYNKTVDQVLEEHFQDEGAEFSRMQALNYASVNLGGCSEDMVQYIYGTFAEAYIQEGARGYTILDSEGNVLESVNPELKTTGETYTFPVEGQYLHMVSEMPSSEKYPDPVASEESIQEGFLNGRYGVVDILPADGSQVAVYKITVGYADESGEGMGSIDPIGMIYHEENGRVIFRPNQKVFLETGEDRGDITYISFRSEDDTILYEAASDTAVGTVYFQDGSLIFASGAAQSQTVSSFADVYHAQFYSSGDPSSVFFELEDTDTIGFMEVDEEGRLIAVLYDLQDKVQGEGVVDFPVSRVKLFCADGQVIDYTGPGGVSISENQTYLRYSSTDPAFLGTAAAGQNTETGGEAFVPATEHQALTQAMEEAMSGERQDEGTAAAGETAPQETAVKETAAPETAPEGTGEAPAIPETTEAPTVPETTQAPTVPETTVPETVPETQAPTVPETQPYTVPETEAAAEPPATEPMLINGRELWEYSIHDTVYYDSIQGQEMYAEYIYLPMPAYTVELYTSGSSADEEAAYTILRILRNFRNDLFLYLGVSLLVFAITAVFLCVSAGHKAKTDEIHAGGLNRLPLDLYFLLGGAALTGLSVMGVEGTEYLLGNNLTTACVFALAAAFLACLTIVGFCFAFVAQVKTPGGYWWRNTCFVRLFVLWIRLLVWLEKFLTGKCFPWLVRNGKTLWHFAARAVLAVYLFAEKVLKAVWRFLAKLVKKTTGFLGGVVRRYFALLPFTWQWMVAGFLLVFVITIATATGNALMMLICMALAVAIVLYVSHCFGALLESTKRMSKGDLDSKVDDKLLVGCFQEFAGDLNDLADVAVVAAQKQLKSERMKTELITNVSHDIKTPLTSIINYVDLLQKPHTEEEGDMYLEVLERQSQRLKKLIEDLMDMSKASTGNMAVDLTELDAVECVNQALGEFGDKLEKSQLIPVFRHGGESAMMVGDGRLVWRVLSNLLGNAVKYAMPGTRLYIDLQNLEGKVVISLKNISRDELNVDAEELMERFVRGDDSRNTEGSGLGLNIAKSLMELQKGQLQLLVDGDLFKVTLIFPGT